MKLLTILLALMLLLPSASVAQSQPYDIYVITDLTGSAAFLGKAAAQMLEAMEKTVNRTGGIHGRPIHFVIEDSGSNPAVAVQLFSAVAAKNVPLILGPGFSATCSAVLPLVTNGPMMYCFSNAIHPASGSYAFSALASSGDLAVVMLRNLRISGYTKIASLNTTDATGTDGDQVLRAALALPENRGVTMVANEHFNVNDISVAAQLSRVKESGAQALIGWTSGTPLGTILRGVRDAGMDNMPVITHSGNASSIEMEQFESFLPPKFVVVGYRFLSNERLPKELQSVKTDFDQTFSAVGVKPDVVSVLAYDAALLAISALRKLGTDATAKQVRDYILSQKNFPGINGYMNFTTGDQRGLGPDALVLARWDKQKKVFVPISKPGGAPL